MDSILKRIFWFGFGFMVVIATSPAAYADDTELFFARAEQVNTNEINANPNILFVLDTSGSMRGEILTQEAWDPDKTFSGEYESDRIYWSRFGNEPSPNTNRWFEKGVLHCEAAREPLRGLGVFQDNFAGYKAESTGGGGWWCAFWPWLCEDAGGTSQAWLELSTSDHDRPTECEDDAGQHGEGVDGAEVDPSKPYVADGDAGPWSDSQNFTWNDQYTIYDGNYLNWKSGGGTVTKTRLQIVQEVVNNLMDNMTGVNVGLMRFNYQEGGPVMKEVQPIDTSRDEMKAAVSALFPDGWTPLSETLYEAQQYYAGRSVDYGNEENDQLSVAGSRVGDNINNDTYDSPIEFTCQKNYVILLSDGEPTRDSSANTKIRNLPGFQLATGNSYCDGNQNNGRCLDDVAGYMANHDLSDLDGEQTVTTYTVGFTEDLKILQDTASEGGGFYRLADDTSSLAITLTEIVLDIFDEATSFTAPAVPVNAFNRTENLLDVYVSVFEPSGRMHWPGNLKKYRLVNGEIYGQNDLPAIDPDTGFFRNDPPVAHSYWSDAPDGDNVKLGGAANEIPAWSSTRNVYSNLTGLTNVNLADGNNSVDLNSTLTGAFLGAPDEQFRDDLIDWVRGKDLWDVDDDGDTQDDRHQMGAALHVSPRTLVYGGTQENPEIVVFVSTNDGYLHAIDPDDGTELWSFIPARLLDRMYGLYANANTENVDYGLDGQLALYIKNNDFEPGINPSTEQAFLVFGMRRGGSSLFALDVTNKTNPKLAWVIDTSSDPALADLGQTWSTPSFHQVDIDGTEHHVAIIGGGYDDGQDEVGYFEDNVGNAVYMIDVEDGSVLWSAGANAYHDLVMNTQSNAEANATMKHSIPAPVNGLDLTGDGFLNRIYAVDMGGRIWRFDVNNGETADELVHGGLIASLGAADLEAPGLTDVRRFYTRLDVVAVISDKANYESFIALNVGSGHRAHPLEEDNEDWFFSVRDFNVFNFMKTDAYDTDWTTFDDLIDITTDVNTTVLNSDPGWKLGLVAGAGEKALTDSFTFKGTVFFTTFAPTPRSNSCTEAVHGGGTNRLYRVSVLDGAPAPRPDGPPILPPPDDPDDPDDPPGQDGCTDDPSCRYEDTNRRGIIEGDLFFPMDDCEGDDCPEEENESPVGCFGIGNCPGLGIPNDYMPTYWFQDETQ